MLKLEGLLTDADKKFLSSLNGDEAHDEGVAHDAGEAVVKHVAAVFHEVGIPTGGGLAQGEGQADFICGGLCIAGAGIATGFIPFGIGIALRHLS